MDQATLNRIVSCLWGIAADGMRLIGVLLRLNGGLKSTKARMLVASLWGAVGRA
ncbi:MAG: hypothetical protein ACK46L_13490 [Synechococcaceae cyanobacterium]|jgi:hypothetical protein